MSRRAKQALPFRNPAPVGLQAHVTRPSAHPGVRRFSRGPGSAQCRESRGQGLEGLCWLLSGTLAPRPCAWTVGVLFACLRFCRGPRAHPGVYSRSCPAGLLWLSLCICPLPSGSEDLPVPPLLTCLPVHRPASDLSHLLVLLPSWGTPPLCTPFPPVCPRVEALLTQPASSHLPRPLPLPLPTGSSLVHV